jgi:hypothetical protein
MLKLKTHSGLHDLFRFNKTSLFPSVKKNPELFLRIISLAHAPMNVTDVSIDIRQSMLKLKTHSGLHDLFRF